MSNGRNDDDPTRPGNEPRTEDQDSPAPNVQGASATAAGSRSEGERENNAAGEGGQQQGDQARAAQNPGTQASEPVTQPLPHIEVKDNQSLKINAGIQAEIEDALSLLEFAIASGFKMNTGASIDPAVVIAIKSAAARGQAETLLLSDWINFELAYHALAAVLAPVSAETLANTRDLPHQSSPARKFSKKLWYWTAVSAGIIILVELGLKAGGAPETPAMPKWPPSGKEALDAGMHLGQLVEPYAYGALGACAYLLRSAHMYIYNRTFDLRRRSEYYNRIILGSVAGGAIFMFVSSQVGEDSSAVTLSSGALAFIAGYSNDFLFNAIQRIVNAIFPKSDTPDRPAGRPRAPADAPGAVQPGPLGQRAGGG